LLAAPRAKAAAESKPAPAFAKANKGAGIEGTLGLGLEYVAPRAAKPAPAGSATPATSKPAGDARDAELFTTLRDLLGGREAQRASDGYTPSNEEVQSVLGALQARPISPMLQDGKLAQRTVAL